MVTANKTRREKMSRNFIYSAIEKGAITAFLLLCLSIVLPGSAHAKGGDLIAPFPVTDALALKQEAKAMATDSSGNIIVTGYANAGGMNNNYHTVKFRADGSGIAWRSTFDKSGGDDQATAVAIDSADNVIVTGTVWNGSNTDIHTIKYSGVDGSVLWQHTWSGAAGGADIATSIAIDTGDNIYIAGYTANTNGNDDYLILKYPAAGTTPAWQDIYNSSYNSNDRILSIAAGLDGIAVTGISSKGGTDFDILTRKHGFDGTLIWEQRKASPTGGDDRGRTVKIDSTGSVIISGYLYNGQNNDIYTAKYAAAAPGTALWEKAYAGGGNDEPLALWLDTNDEIYLTGHTYTYSGNEDFYTVRYASTDGVKIWDRIYDSGSDYTDIATAIIGSPGAEGDIYVTGYTSTNINENFTTIKYKKSSGELIWQKNYQSTTNKSARPVGIALGLSGDPVIAGWTDTSATSYDFVVVRYDYGRLDPPSGLSVTATSNSTTTLNWLDNSNNETTFKIERKLGESGVYTQIATVAANVTTYADSSLTPNSYYYYRIRSNNATNGDSYYSSEAHALTKIVSYDPPAWIYQYNGADNREDEAVGIVVGSDNHPIVTGFSDLTEEGVTGAYSFDYMTIKLDKDTKAVKWKALYDSGDGGTDMAAGITLDNNGDAVVAGTAYLSGGSEKSDDLYTIKYSSAGHTDPLTNPLAAWGAQYGTQAGIDQATAIQAAKDSANNIIVIGHGINTNNDEDMFIIKYRPDGTTAWPPIVYDGPAHGNDYPSAVAIDQTGDIFITGSTENAAGNFDIYTAKYNGATGALIWSQTYAGAGNGDDHGLSLAIDNSGDIYITGSSVNAAGNEEWITINYDGADSSPNRELWRKVHNGLAAPVNGNDRGIAIGIDPMDGDIIVAGTSYRTLTDSDFHLIRYSPADGSIIWERNFDRPAKYDYLTAMAIDSSGYIYLTGNSRNGPDTDPAFDANSDILALIYDFEGTFLSASEYDGGKKDEAVAIAVNYQGEAFIAGVTLNAGNPDYLVMKQKNNYILVPAPLTLFPQADATKMNLTWRENNPGTQFKLERTAGPVLPTSTWSNLISGSTLGMTSFMDTGLSPGGSYCYRIYAYTESPSLNSRTLGNCGITTLGATVLDPLVVDSATQISLSWSQVADNTGYKIERKTGAAGTWALLATKATNVTTHADLGLTPGTIYYYRVSTNSASGYGLASNEQFAPTRPIAPVLAVPTNITNTQMYLAWNTVAGAATYTLQYKVSGGSYANFPACTAIGGSVCTVSGLTVPNVYSFQVKATNTGGDSVFSNETAGTAALAVPTWGATPTNITNTGMTLTWVNPAVTGSGTITYTLQYRLASGAYLDETTASACSGTTALSCDVTGLTANSSYNYRIKAANTAGSSLWSSEVAATKTLLDAPVLSSASGAAGQIALAWTPITGASGYTVQQAVCSDSNNPSTCRGVTGTYAAWANLATGVVPTAYTATGLAAGANYRYQVVATVPGNSSAAGNILSAWTNLTPPTLIVTPASSTALNLNWDAQSGETNYTVELSTSGIGGTYAAVPAATALAINTISFAHAGLALDTEYCYKIKAYSSEPTPPPAVYSNIVCKITPPDAPVITITTNEVESSYTVIEDASKYWTMADYWIGRPVVITSGGNTYTKRIDGNVNSAFYASPAFTTETINKGDSYTILQTVTGKATGNDSASPYNSLFDADKNWGMNEWAGFKIKILNSANVSNVGLERTLTGASGTIKVYASANFLKPIFAGDTYQIASYFGAATATGSTTQLTHSGNNGWNGANWAGYYLLMTSGSNSGHARKIISNNTTTLTTDAFPYASAVADTYLIAPVAKVSPYMGTAVGTGSTSTVLVDTGHAWQANYTGHYLQMTSGSNLGQARLVTANDSSAKTITVAPAFDSAIVAGDAYLLVPTAQFASYFGVAAGSPGNSSTQLVDTANSWLTDWSLGYFLMMTSGANNGQSRTISGYDNVTKKLTVATSFTNPISATDSYLIGSISSTGGGGKLTTALTPASTAKGTAKITLGSGSAELYSAAPGYANDYSYEMLSLRDLTPLTGNFDAKFDYTTLSGLITPDTSLSYLYLASSYASLRHDFQSPTGRTYNSYIERGRVPLQDNGRTTASAASLATIYDTRTMAGSTVQWKSWATDQWKDYYLQMTSGPNNQLVRKVTANGAGSVTLESAFPNDAAVKTGTAAVSGNSKTKLVDATITNWTVNQWQNFYLHMASGANAGKTMLIISSDASSVTVAGTGFTSAIANGDAYRIFSSSGDTYRINVITGTAAINGSSQDGKNSTNSLLVDSSDNIGTSLPPKNWGVNQWQGFYLYMSSGPNIGQFRTISANTANTITVGTPLPYQIVSSDSYTIFDPRSAAQAQEAYWLTIYEPITNVSEQLILPTNDVSGKIRLAKSGNSLQFYTAPSSGVWQLRRQLDLQAGDVYTPAVFWIYQLGRLPHVAGTNVRTKIENFAFTVPASTPGDISSTYWSPEVGHINRRLSLSGSPVEVAWSRASTAVFYEIERCASTEPNNPNGRGVGTCTTFTQTQPVDLASRLTSSPATVGLTAGNTYRFRVRIKYNATDYTAWSNELWISVTPLAPYMYVPGSTTTVMVHSFIDVAGESQFRLFWKVRSGASCTDDSWNGPILLEMNNPTYTQTGLNAGTYYCFKMSAVGAVGPPVTANSPYSNIVTQTTRPLAPGTIVFTGVTASSVTLSWPQTQGNSGYQVDRSLDNSDWRKWINNVGSVGQDVTNFTDSGLLPGTLYYYRVSANSPAGFSAVSAVQSIITSPAAPVLSSAVISAAEIDISWPVVVGATNYKVERNVSGGSYSEITNIAAAYTLNYCGDSYPTVSCQAATPVTVAFQNTALTENRAYCYRLKAWNVSGGDSVYSNEKCATTLNIAPPNLVATALNSFKIRLDWSPITCTPVACGAPEGYEVERLVRAGNWVNIATVGAGVNSFTDRRAIDPIKQYRYRVRSYSGAYRSPYTTEAVVYTPPYSAGDNVAP